MKKFPTHSYDYLLHVQREISETLNESTDIYETLQSCLEKLLKMMNLSTGWIFLLYNHDDYELASYHQLPPALNKNDQAIMKQQEGCSDCYCLNRYREGRLAQAVQSIRCARLSDALSLDKHADTNGLTHHASVPLTVRGSKVGLLNLATPGMRDFEKEELLLLESIAFQIGATVERIRLYHKQSDLLITKERTRLARDLHDSVKQKLFALSLTSKGIEALSKDLPAITDAAKDVGTLSQEALQEMQSLIWQLRPEHGEDPLADTLEKHALRLGLRPFIQCRTLPLTETVNESLTKIGQEAIYNVFKHAETDQLSIVLDTVDEGVVFEISDPGVGGAFPHPSRLGMKSMQERAEQIGADFTVTSRTEQGQKLRFA
ncbi:GAF domain-containing sensor histidine kinase [Geomicrobium sp. JCM 19039]|uniref:GAF domain-containing sensor histidine kinase n=1 Tax=Geomicrobium sp. JCM 19039 TaxID=1460636 RepID=UPI00045F170A|nr:GAF domain-containing sensor histidine kinase [Geomicrobium sp. JCM 19039]GAK12098.1 nitrate/nitrite sensor protein [Geomicrobium sp. JCM 19039]